MVVMSPLFWVRPVCVCVCWNAPKKFPLSIHPFEKANEKEKEETIITKVTRIINFSSWKFLNKIERILNVEIVEKSLRNLS